MLDCLFCRMECGEIPVSKVAENEFAFAIDDINPRAPVHCLIISRRHIATAADITAEFAADVAGVFELATATAKVKRVSDAGYRLAFNVGEAAGMTIWHLHLHLLGGRSLGPEG